jgi:NADPH:quinone reductase-like Zn-dependent oxidoreductase
MTAFTLNGYDGVLSLRIAEVPVPEIGARDVLVKISAASVNPIDYKISIGYLRGGAGYKFPHVLGRDFCGVIEKVGYAVKEFAPGDRVFGVADQARWGTQAEYASIPSATIARAPETLTDIEAGSLPVAGLSAIAGLVSVGKVTRGQRVLIHGAAGGVGSFAVQLAKHIGATVAATASADSAAFVQSLGADLVIDYKQVDFSKVIKDCDLVFDLIGGDVRYHSFNVLKPGGMLVHISVPLMTQQPPRQDVTVKQAAVPYDHKLLESIAAMVDAKAIRPCVGDVFLFPFALQAYDRVKRGHARGKTMLSFGPSA